MVWRESYRCVSEYCIGFMRCAVLPVVPAPPAASILSTPSMLSTSRSRTRVRQLNTWADTRREAGEGEWSLEWSDGVSE